MTTRPATCPSRLHGLNAVEHRLTAQEHARPAAIRLVVDRLMLIGGPVAKVPAVHCDQTAIDRLLQQALLKVALEQIGKQCENVEPH